MRPKALSIDDAVQLFRRGAALLDLRSKDAYTQKHVPGSMHLEADSQLANKIGFVLDPQQPVVLLLNDRADYEAVVYSLARVGYEQVLGYLAEGLRGWEQAGLPVTSSDTQNVNARELDELIRNGNGSRPVVVDVREPWEYALGHIPDALLMPLGQMAQRVKELDADRPVAVVCASGNRSQSAAALLGQKGFKKVYNLVGGMHGWQQAGLRVGVVGLASNIVDKTMPPYFSEGLRFTLGKEELPEAIRKLRTDERVDLVILLSHLGFPQDMQLTAEAPGGIDVLLSGHTHNRLYRPALVDDTIIIQSGSQGSFLGRLDLELSGGRISDTRHRLIEVSADPPANPQAQALVDIALAPFREELGEVVGETAGPLDRGHSLEATFARDPYRQMGGYIKRALGLKAYIKIENPHGQRLQKLLVGGEELRPELRYTAAIVTEQGVPAQYGEQRQNTPARAIDALRQYLGKRRAFRPELFDTFVVI